MPSSASTPTGAFTAKGDTLHAIALAWPKDGKLTVRSLTKDELTVESVSLLGHEGSLTWSQTDDGLEVTMPSEPPCDYAYALKINAE
jgi:alpha-L-fucosidase